MSLMWLAAWLIRRRPRVQMFKSWNNWGIALAVCFALDLISGAGRTARAGSRAGKKVEEAPKSVPVGV
jgi:hypothetical protein